MRNRCRKMKGTLVALLMAIVMAGASPAGAMDVHATERNVDTIIDVFDIEAELVGSDENTYNVSVTVTNHGVDWEGIVRVTQNEDYLVPTAYDTTLTLPQGSEKQFVVKIPKGASDSGNGSIKVHILDKKSKVIETRTYSQLLLEEMECLNMGILSDDYSSLTYLDMGGGTIYYYGMQFPIKLEELKQGNLVDSLDALTILVIDKYNTDVLTDEELVAIMQWVDDGGVLMVGTGAYAEDVWSGLADSIPEVQILDTIEAGEDLTGKGVYGSMEVDISQLTLAQLYTTNNMFYENYYSYGLSTDMGDGAIGILPFSLVDLGKAQDTIYVDYYTQEDYVFSVLEEITSYATSRYSSSNYAYDMYGQMYSLRSMLGVVGNSGASLSFGVLKFIVILYVIFVGPVLYLILRAAKKREWYWFTVPVTALLGIIIVFFAGRGFEVVSTKVYSVTTQDLDAKRQDKTYLYCYDAEYKEWDLQLADGYDYAGPMMNQNYNYMSSTNDNVYYHRIQNEGGNLSIGLKPSQAFEDSFFYAGKAAGKGQDMGSIDCKQIRSEWGGISGEITNNTDKDFSYFVVIVDNTYYVYENLPAGGSCSLRYQVPIYYSSQGNNIRNTFYYDFLYREYDNRDAEEISALGALGVGVQEVYPQTDEDVVVVCGVTADWEKAVDDDCSEVSYGCLYTIQ